MKGKNIQAPAVTSRDIAQWQGPFAEVLDIVRHRTRDAWVPTWRSDAADEVTVTSRLLRKDSTPWGMSPTEGVFAAAAMLTDAALESAQAVHLLLSENPTSTLVVETITRAALEAACQAWNLQLVLARALPACMCCDVVAPRGRKRPLNG